MNATYHQHCTTPATTDTVASDYLRTMCRNPHQADGVHDVLASHYLLLTNPHHPAMTTEAWGVAWEALADALHHHTMLPLEMSTTERANGLQFGHLCRLLGVHTHNPAA